MRFLPLFLIPLVAGCSFFHGEDGAHHLLPDSNLPVVFADALSDTDFSVSGGEGVIVVTDRTTTGICHRWENRGAFLDEGVVTLWVAHTGVQRGTCPLLGVFWSYEATISDLSPGTYSVRIEYIGSIHSDTQPREKPEVEVTVH